MSNRSNIRMGAAILTFALCAGAAACQTSDDPNQGGFISGIVGLTSGAYEKRVEKKRAELKAAETERAALQEEAEKSKREQAPAAAERIQSEERLAALDGEIKALNEHVAKAEKSRKLEETELKRLKNEVSALQQQRDLVALNPGLDDEQRKHSIATLVERKRRLEAALMEALDE